MYGANIPGSTTQLTKRLSNRKRRQLTDEAMGYAMRCRLILIACLAQSGGSITITKGTINQAGMNLAHLDYAVVDGTTENDSIVKLVDDREPVFQDPGPTPALQITKVEEPEKEPETNV